MKIFHEIAKSNGMNIEFVETSKESEIQKIVLGFATASQNVMLSFHIKD
jgi:hypothetical protein